jgi:hypothetical protein
VFVSHGSHDTWIARQMARCIGDCGVETFIDAYDIKTGDRWEDVLITELDRASELAVMFTPFSRSRAWVWMEIGAALRGRKRVVPFFYGMTMRDLEKQGTVWPLSGTYARGLNDFDVYLAELRERMAHGI